MKAVRVAINAKGRSISGSAPRGSPADTPRPTNRAVSTKAWNPESAHREIVSPGDCIPPLPPPNKHTHPSKPREVIDLAPSHQANTLAFRSPQPLLWYIE